MAIPREDRLDYICRQDMNAIESAVNEIRTAMKNVDIMMPKTWIGKKADNWRADHEGLMKRLKTLFDAFPAEENRLVEQARQKQAQMNNTLHKAGCLGFGFRGRKGIGRRLGWLGVVTGQQPSAASMETHGVRQEQTRR